MPLQIRRGTELQRTSMTQPLAVGELLFVTSPTNRIYVGDGTTLGGIAVTGYTDENAQDAVAPMFTGGSHSGINFVYNDASNIINATVDLSNYNGTISASSFKGTLVADDSTALVDAVDGRIFLDGTVKGNIVPDADVAYDLGSATYRFRDLYLSGSSIKLGAATITATGTAVNLPLGSTIGGSAIGIPGGDLNVNIVADDSTVIVNTTTEVVTAQGGFVGNVTGNVNGVITGTAGSSLVGNVTGNLTGNVTGNVNGIVTGTAGSSLVGNVTGNLTGNVTGNVNGIVTGTAGSSLVGNVTGNVTGDLTGNVTSTGTSTFTTVDINGGTIDGTTIGATTASTVRGTTITATTSLTAPIFIGNLTGNIIGNVNGNVTGNIIGDVKGSVFAEDSTLMVDATSGNINTDNLTVITKINVDNIETTGLNVRTNANSPLSITGIGTLSPGTSNVFFNIRAAKGSITSPTTTAGGDYLGGVNIQGYTGSTYKTAASIQAIWAPDATLSDTYPASAIAISVGGNGSVLHSAVLGPQGVFTVPIFQMTNYATTAYPSGGPISLLSGVTITGVAGQFQCTATTLTVGGTVTIRGTLAGATISGYASPTTYYIVATNGTTTFTLSTTNGGSGVTTSGTTPTGVTYELSLPQKGMIIFDSTTNDFMGYDGTAWVAFTGP